ncbi:MAG: RND family transporter [Segniliparus sp.]|uniref:MMPL/RND family transporter n=1 Tax=Segniliparus sp. TaxID=2804064 RepID=UPI003F394243
MPVIVAWLLLASWLNLAVPRLEQVVERHALSFLPDEASSVKALANMGRYFGQGSTNNVVTVLLEGSTPLDEDAHRYYAALTQKLRTDKKHVVNIVDVWSDPMLSSAFQSSDKKAAFVYINLTGNMGTALALESTQAVRDAVSAASPPAGLKVYVTGPSAVVNDELVAINRSSVRMIFTCALLIVLIMLFVYRSPITGGGPLLVVAIALATARQIVAFLGEHEIMGVSIFASSLLAGIILGAGTDYGIFLLGRYQEARRAGEDPTTAYYTALSGVQHIIFASGLTIAGATACMVFTRLSIFSTSGLPCTIGVLTMLAAALTLGPAMLALASRFGLYEPRGQRSPRRWRRIATRTVRWPLPVLAGSVAVLLAALLILPTYTVSYNELAAQPDTTEANLGLEAADRHLPTNILNPNMLLVESDHDMRNPADLIALAKMTNAIYGVDGVRAVQGITRPLTSPLLQGTLPYQAGYIGERMSQTVQTTIARLQDIAALSERIGQLSTVVQGLQRALASAEQGLGHAVHSGNELQAQLLDVLEKARSIRDDVQPLAESGGQLLDSIPNCENIPYCHAAVTGLSLLDDLDQFDEHKIQDVLDGASTASNALPQLDVQISALGKFLADMQQMLAPLRSLLDTVMPQLDEIKQFTEEVSNSFVAGNPSEFFFLPKAAFDSPLMQSALRVYFSPDGKATRMLVMGEMNAFSKESMDCSARIIPTAKAALKGTSLGGSKVSLGGAGGTLLNIAAFAKEDFVTSAIAAFAFVFCVVLILLRSLVAALMVIGTVGLSYLSGLGLSTAIWQHLVGLPLHWVVAPCSFIILVAVGADYNLLLVARFKEELHAGTKTGIIRSMVGTGRVVTTAGLVFGGTMLAMMTSASSTFAQIGSTVAIGLFLDTLVVRSFILPAAATLLGRWFWWPAPERIPTI